MDLFLSPVLADVTNVVAGVIGAGAIVIGLLIGAAVGFRMHKTSTAGVVEEANAKAREITARAETDARAAADRVRLEAEQKALEAKKAAEKELDGARNELREAERRLQKREDAFDRKEDGLNQKEQTLQRKDSDLQRQIDQYKTKEAKLGEKEAALDKALEEQTNKLYQLTQLSPAQAKEELLRRVEDECRLDVAKVVRKMNEEAEAEAKKKAQEITLMAVQRYATEHTQESTVRAVALPSDDIKGRIIGREGRNIRAIEKATGVDIIVDDTPGVIVVSCFDKVRQAVAVESLERLIADGRMHPSRIEEVVEKVKSEIEGKIIQFGKDAILEANLRGIHPKVSEAMGKLRYRTSYGQNVLRHSIEVGYLCQIIAEQLGLDGALARRCGFLHDIGKAMDHEMEGGHPKIGMDFAKQYGEKDPVLNAIGGHHADIPSTSFYTPIVMAADAVSSARPGARRESMEKYVQRLNELQDIAMGFRGVTEAYAIQAGREVRVMIDAARVGDDEAYLIAHDIAKRVSEQMTFPGEIKVTVLRETRAIEIAR
ncbi:MAG: ribonuclease Y [Tepidisphaera sp.]|jgi:ribonucrease Y